LEEKFVKMPICLVCLKSGILCPSCQAKVDRGEVDELDIKIARIFLELENKFPMIKNATFFKAVDVDSLIVILVKSNNRLLRPVWNRISRIMGNKLKKQVRIVEKTPSIRQIAEQVLSPVKVKGVNIIWLPDGSRENYIKISRFDLNRLKISKENAEKVLSQFTKEIIRIISE